MKNITSKNYGSNINLIIDGHVVLTLNVDDVIDFTYDENLNGVYDQLAEYELNEQEKTYVMIQLNSFLGSYSKVEDAVKEVNELIAKALTNGADTYSDDELADIENECINKVLTKYPDSEVTESRHYIDSANYVLMNGYISDDNCPHHYVSMKHIKEMAEDYAEGEEELDTNVKDFMDYIKIRVGTNTYNDFYKNVLKSNYSEVYDALEEALKR